MEGLVASLVASAGASVKRTVKATVIQLIAGIFFLVALGFLTTGAFILLANQHGNAQAAIAVGAVYALVAIVLLIVYALTYGRTPRMPAAKPALSRVNQAKNNAAEAVEDIANQSVKAGQMALLNTLIPLVKNIKPIHLAALGLVAGFISGKSTGK
jgi:membrane protein implicated in regulation of membrane protease activity